MAFAALCLSARSDALSLWLRLLDAFDAAGQSRTDLEIWLATPLSDLTARPQAWATLALLSLLDRHASLPPDLYVAASTWPQTAHSWLI